MEIGGYDVIIEHTKSQEYALDLAMQIIRKFWPGMLIEECEPFYFFVYPNQVAKDSWDDGTDPDMNGMIHVISGNRTLTLVHDGNDEIVMAVEKAFAPMV